MLTLAMLTDAAIVREHCTEPVVDAERRQPVEGVSNQAIGRVLIVDDEADILQSVGRRLCFAGYEVSFASDGAEATQMALAERPDVIILDIGMPCGDGHTVAERIRSNPKTMFTPIIFLTARTADIDKQKAEEVGAFAYVTKPFKSEELVDLVKQAIGRTRAV